MRNVKLILLDDVPSLGDAGELVAVKPGYARNYLLPQGKASLATEANMRQLEHHRRVAADKVARERKTKQADRERLEAVSLEFAMQAGEAGRLFGSVTVAQIAELLAKKGFTVDRRKISLSEPIKQVGEHTVAVRLHRDVVANVKVQVVATEPVSS